MRPIDCHVLWFWLLKGAFLLKFYCCEHHSNLENPSFEHLSNCSLQYKVWPDSILLHEWHTVYLGARSFQIMCFVCQEACFWKTRMRYFICLNMSIQLPILAKLWLLTCFEKASKWQVEFTKILLQIWSFLGFTTRVFNLVNFKLDQGHRKKQTRSMDLVRITNSKTCSMKIIIVKKF